MFTFEEPSDLNDDWYLGTNNKFPGKIPNKLLKNISNAHIIGIQFLFENYMKQRGGAILNEDEGLNMPLQVSTFLSSVKEKIDLNSPVLIITSDFSLCKWHYHMSEAGFIPNIINSEDFCQSDVYLLSYDSLKLAESILSFEFFCVVMDDFDNLATKLIVKKLKGCFNIGLTERNFYKKPDQRLKWLMLNWASPGCVGKLNDFYRIDRLHSQAFADNYRFWWFRLTWQFCDSFEFPNEEYFEEYQKKLQERGEINDIRCNSMAKRGIKRSIIKNKTAEWKKSKSEHIPILTSSSDNTESEGEEIPKSAKVDLVSDGRLCRKFVKSEFNKDVEAEQNASEIFLQDPLKAEAINYESSPESPLKDTKYASSENVVSPSLDKSFQEMKAESESDLFITEFTKDIVESDEEEPILSIINSKVEINTSHILPQTTRNDENSISVVKNNNEETSIDSEQEEDSFLSDFILGK